MKRHNGTSSATMTASTGEKRVSIDDSAPTTIADSRSTQAPSSNGDTKSYLYSSPNGAYTPYMDQPMPLKQSHTPASDSHAADEHHDDHFVPNEIDIASPLRSRAIRSNGTTSNGNHKSSKKTKRKSKSFFKRCYKRWIKGTMSSFSSLFLAVLLWYGLGVISIATSKVLLMPAESQQQHENAQKLHHHHHRHHHPLIGGVPPLFLTLQQLCIGSCLLRFLIHVRFMGSPGLVPWPVPTKAPSSRRIIKRSQSVLTKVTDCISSIHFQLLGAGFFFALGFLMTNYGFAGSSASFVETIKAAEPITSATVAVWNGIETLSQPEIVSLLAIVCGVVLSTMGNTPTSSGSSTAGAQSAFAQSIQACIIVMIANLSFSFRGLFQKLFRATPEGSTQVVDDLNLQLRMQQIGVGLLIGPVLLYEVGAILIHLGSLHSTHGLWKSGVSTHYLTLSLVNGFAFTCYNLASTYILSRISVVHHAALNCVRRVFAIVMTSIYFVIPVTFLGGTGIMVSLGGFMSFTHYKAKRQQQPKPVSSLLPVSMAK